MNIPALEISRAGFFISLNRFQNFFRQSIRQSSGERTFIK
jgi:hypothetical protein